MPAESPPLTLPDALPILPPVLRKLGAGERLPVEAYDRAGRTKIATRSEEHTSELQSLTNLVCRLLLDHNNKILRTPVAESRTANDCTRPDLDSPQQSHAA